MTSLDMHTLTVDAPPQFLLRDVHATPLASHALRIEGTLVPAERLREYVTQSRVRIFDEPSPHSCIGFAPPGKVLRGTAPSSRGWIALDDNECFVSAHDAGLVARPLAKPVAFAKRVSLPADAILERARAERPEPKWAVAFGPRVANWVELSDQTGFVMIEHPRFGTLLESLSPSAP